jgi:hypothetical protein
VYVNVYWLIAKFAITEMLAVTSASVRGFRVNPSLQPVKWYPVFATALTGVPDPPALTVCEATPDMVPSAPAAYVNV